MHVRDGRPDVMAALPRGARVRAAFTAVAWPAEVAVVLAVSIPLLFCGLGFSFLDPDEGLYADAVRSMLTHGDWVLPRFNGWPYLEKPPLYFWLGAATMAFGVPAEWALRGVSAAAALASVVLTWGMGRIASGREGGLFAGLALATTVGYALYTRKAATDLVFVACLALAVWGFVRDLHSGRPARRRFLWLYVGTALGVLAKGLIGLLLPAAIVAGSVALLRRPSVRELNLGRGLALLAAVALPWHVAAAWRDPALFWFYLGDNQLFRFLNRRAVVEDDVSMTTLAFLLVTFVWLFPWGVFMLARGASDADPAQRSARRVALVWAVVVVAFFALSRSKLEYYALPAFPAIALGVGTAWASGRDVGRWLWVALPGVLLVGAGALWVGARLTPGQALDGLAELNVYYRILRDQGRPFPFESPRPLGGLLQALGLLLVLGWAAAVLAWARGLRRGAFAMLLALGAGIAILIIALFALIEPHHSSRLVAEAIQDRARGDDVIAHEGSLEYSAGLPFYTGRRIVVVNGTRGDLEFASRLPEARGWFLDGHGLARLWDGSRRVFLVTQRPLRDSVAATLQPVVPLGIFGSRWLYSNRRD